MPTGCSVTSIEPLRQWFWRGAYMTSPLEVEAAVTRLEREPPEIREINDDIREERWTNSSLEEVKLPSSTIDVVKRGEALANSERELVIHFEHISKAAALYAKTLWEASEEPGDLPPSG